MTRHQVARLAIALDNEASALKRRIKNHKALTIGMSLDELDAMVKRLEACADVCRAYHRAMTPKDEAA